LLHIRLFPMQEIGTKILLAVVQTDRLKLERAEAVSME
jgi:hypothetical protein